MKQKGTTPLILTVLLLFCDLVLANSSILSEESEKDSISLYINNLNSIHYIHRREARQALLELAGAAIPPLLDDFADQTEVTKIERLRILSKITCDSSLNPLAFACLDSVDPKLRAVAIHYLAGNPEINSNKYQNWTHNLLISPQRSDIIAYLEGIKAPAPREQIEWLISGPLLLDAWLAPLIVRALRKASPAIACQAMVTVMERVDAGRLPSNLLAPFLEGLRHVAREVPTALLVRHMTDSSATSREAASAILQAMISHLFRARRFAEILKIRAELYSFFPAQHGYTLDYADALIQYGEDLDPPARLLVKLTNTATGQDTVRQIERIEALTGLALIDFWTGGNWDVHLTSALDALPRDPEGLPLRRALAKTSLLRGALLSLSGEAGLASYQRALDLMPYDPDQPEIDRLFTGRFSLANLLWKLNRSGRLEEAGIIYQTLVEALREDPSGSAYYPTPEDASEYEDRMRSRIPLERSYFQLHWLGRPEVAHDSFQVFIESTRQSPLFINLDLLAQAHYLDGLTWLDRTRLEESRASMKKGVGLYDEVLGALKTAWPDRATKEATDYYNREKARGLLYLETVAARQTRDSGECLKLTLKALQADPDFDEALLQLAIVRARAGQVEFPRRVLSHLDPYPDRYYNLACLHALLNEHREALDRLVIYFAQVIPPARRPLAARFARGDPDLKSLQTEPDFIDLLNTHTR